MQLINVVCLLQVVDFCFYNHVHPEKKIFLIRFSKKFRDKKCDKITQAVIKKALLNFREAKRSLEILPCEYTTYTPR